MCANCASYIINMQCILIPSFQSPKAFWEIQRREEIPLILSIFYLLLSTFGWCSLSELWGGRARRGRHSPCRSRRPACRSNVHMGTAALSLESWQTASSCLCFADTDAFYSAFSRKTLSRKTLLSTWQNQSSFNFKALGPLDVITCINRMTHPIFLLFVTYISLFSFSWQRADNCSRPWRWCSESNLQTFFVIVWQQAAWPCI